MFVGADKFGERFARNQALSADFEGTKPIRPNQFVVLPGST
jgi:hypothetical protein